MNFIKMREDNWIRKILRIFVVVYCINIVYCVVLLSAWFQRLKIALEISDKGAEGRSYCSIGNCLRAMVQPDKSLECYKRVRPELCSVFFL